MTTEKRTHIGDVKIAYFEKRANDTTDEVDVIAWYRVKTGVLKGQMSKAYCGTFNSAAEAEALYGEMNWNSPYLEPQISLNHLPGEDDPVAGGMYPDDINGGR